MTDPVQPQPPGIPGQQQRPAPPNALIVSLPGNIRDIRDVLRLQGQVAQASSDGTVQIHTDEGDITLKLDPKAPPLQQGEQVDVEIPPGRPPQAARVTPDNPPPRQQSDPQPAPPPRSSQTPVEIDVRDPSAPAPQPQSPPPAANAGQSSSPQPSSPPVTNTQTPPPAPDHPAQLQQVTLEQAVALVTEPEEAVRAVIQQAVTQAQTIVSDAQDDIAASITNATAPFPVKEAPAVKSASPVSAAPVTSAPPVKDSLTPAPVPPAQGAPQVAPDTPELPAPVKILLFFNPANIVAKPAAEPFFTPQISLPQLAAALPQKVLSKLSALLPNVPFIKPANTQGIATLPPGLPEHIKLPPAIAQKFDLPTIAKVRIAAVQVPASLATTITALPGLAGKITAEKLPHLSEPQQLFLQNEKVITATVIGQTPQKFPAIVFLNPESPGAPEKSAFFILRAPVPSLMIGTEISFVPEAEIKTAAPAPQTPALIPLAENYFTPGQWPAMDDVYQALVPFAPQVAHAMANVTPSPANPAQIGPAALFFMAALRGGDLSEWLGGRAVDALRQGGKASAISRLLMDGGALSKLSAEPVSNDWRGMALPLYWENEMQKIMLYYKHDQGGEKESQTGGKQVRFIFDLNLDQMGKVQLDGLFRPKRLDLIVRSQQAFSQSMQMNMRRAYVNALEQTDVSGELSFQNKPGQWVTIKAGRQKFGTSA